MFTPLCSLGICNLIVSPKHRLGKLNPIDCILKLKALFGYNYIQDNFFPNQQARQKVYLFKVFIDGTTSKFDLVRQMQPNDNLQNAWMMFNHVTRVQGWMTMACHIYDLIIYCKITTIMVCDM